MTQSITVKEVNKLLQEQPENIFLLDVRESYEFAIANIGGKLISSREIEHRLSEIDFSRQVIVICHHGIRSRLIADLLTSIGHDNIYNMTGGIDAWSVEIDQALTRY